MRIQNMRVLKKMKISTKREKKIKFLAIAQLSGWEQRPINNSSNQNPIL